MQIIRVNNPFQKQNRIVERIDYSGQSISGLVHDRLNEFNRVYDKQLIVSDLHEVLSISISGLIIPPSSWETTVPTDTDSVIFMPIVSKGSTEKQILNIVIMVAVIYFTGGALMGPLATIGGVAMSSAGALTLAGTLVMAGVVVGTGMLLQSLTPAPGSKIPTIGDQERSQLYGWTPSTVQEQGVVRPRMYGKIKVYGNVLSAHTELTNNFDGQILNALFALSAGPTRHVDGTSYGDDGYGISNIRLNNQPIDNFTDVTHEERFGTLNQTVIENFNDTKTERVVALESKFETPKTHTTSNPGYSHLEVTVQFDQGLFYSGNSGTLENHTVGVKVEISETSAEVWTTIGEADITGNRAEPIFRLYDTKTQFPNGLDTTKDYDIKVSKTTADFSSIRYADRLIFYNVKEVVIADFVYPQTVLLGIKALATNQLSGSIQFSCDLEGKVIRVYNGATWSIEYSTNPIWVIWDLLTQPVILGAGTGASPYAIAQEAGSDIYRGYDPRLSDSTPRFNLSDFYAAAQYCETQVPDGTGVGVTNITKANPGVVSASGHSHENGDTIMLTDVVGMTEVNGNLYTVANIVAGVSYELSGTDTTGFTAYSSGGLTSTVEDLITFNGGFDIEGTVWQQVLKVCEIARCIPYWNGSQIGIKVNRASDPVQMFTVGNITTETFEETFMPESDRVSNVTINFVDSEQDYKRIPFNVFNNNISESPGQTMTLDLFGVTKGSEAWRAGMFRLKQNELIKRTLTFEADIDAIVCELGDIISVQHDIPNWGSPDGEIGSGSDEYGGGGRIILATNDTNAIVTVDRKMLFTDPDWDAGGNTYELMLRTQNDAIETKVITGVEGDNNEIITVSGVFGISPQNGDIWAVGIQNLVTKQFRVMRLEKTADQLVSLKCVEYNANVHESDTAEMDLPNNSDLYDPSVYEDIEVTGLTLTESAAVDESGVILRNIHVSYSIPTDVLWKQAHVYHKAAGITEWTFDGTTDTDVFTIYNLLPETTYDVKVISENNFTTRSIFDDSPFETIIMSSNTDFQGVFLSKRVTGLQLDGQGNDTSFTGNHAKFVWNHINAVDDNSVAASEPLGAGSTNTSQWFKDYEIEIFDGSGTRLRTEYTTNNYYIYTYEKNYEDTRSNPVREFTIDVRARDRFNRISVITSTLTVTNPAPAIPVNVEFQVLPKSYIISFDPILIPDVAGYRVHASQSPGFSVSESNLVYDGPNTFATISVVGEPNGLWYVKVTVYDTFGIDSLNYTNEYTVGDIIPPAVPEGFNVAAGLTSLIIGWDPNLELDLSGYQIWTSATSPVITSGSPDYDTGGGVIRTVAAIENLLADTTYYTKMRAYDITGNYSDFTDEVSVITGLVDGGADIQAGTIAADRMAVAKLSAITATLGEVLAGTISSSTVTGSRVQTEESGKRVVMEGSSIKLVTAAPASGKIGTVGNGGDGIVIGTVGNGGDGEIVGSGFLAVIFDDVRGIPFNIQSEQSVADFHYFNRSVTPAGAAEPGDTCVVSGIHYTCTDAGTPGTWAKTGTQS
ncbi:hypothetical protein KAR91_20615 [Candidatus Pacearchaeota archaeon]|nr:hypothetical protein [Candidatus Pacearchaeota archaeon]